MPQIEMESRCQTEKELAYWSFLFTCSISFYHVLESWRRWQKTTRKRLLHSGVMLHLLSDHSVSSILAAPRKAPHPYAMMTVAVVGMMMMMMMVTIINGYREPAVYNNRHPKYPQKSTSRRNKLDPSATKFHPSQSTMKKTEDNTPVLIVDGKATEHQIKQGAKKLYAVGKARVGQAWWRKKHMPHWFPTVMLWMLPTKLGSPKWSPSG
ncbi:60S ribosomal protein L23a [Galemys pyrenaicus]|uniref:60S ribosomal protein L23a n=1 Tax=Galemys pyrenaicus TaxID=202257 RepID=A0A8J6A351_GALPY|nr:60S ribosomal protein L23a [Galemys pyrenaicus]